MPEPVEYLRPGSLAAVAESSWSLSDFGRNLQDFLHTLRTLSTRKGVAATIQEEPPILAGRFSAGAAADAWLAAYAEFISSRLRLPPPKWCFDPSRIARRPWFADGDPSAAARAGALVFTPLPFKRRNLYAANIDLPLRIRRGRPRVSVKQKRCSNAERQKRFRQRRAAELKRLRRLDKKS